MGGRKGKRGERTEEGKGKGREEMYSSTTYF